MQIPQELLTLGVQVQEDITFSQLTSLHVGGPIGLVVECSTRKSVFEAVKILKARSIPTLHLGGGSNVIAPDEGWPGAVLRVTAEGMSCELDPMSHTAVVFVEAGVNWDDLVSFTVDSGLGGLECLSGIPGNVGASVKQNIGAYGSQLSDVLVAAELWNWSTGHHQWASGENLKLGYRSSSIRHEDSVVVLALRLCLSADGLSVPIHYRELALSVGVHEGERAPVEDVRNAVLALRARKGMLIDDNDHDTWSTGSFFINPVMSREKAENLFPHRSGMPWFEEEESVKLSAAWLIEAAGFAKGFPGDDAPARLSTKHTLAITNRGNATTSDIIALAHQVRAGVWRSYGVRLEPEPILLGPQNYAEW